jgi:periplasmic divalent cation tolerance protein
MKAQVVLITIKSRQGARKLAEQILQHRLAACITVIPQVDSLYWWEEKICNESEALMVIKTVKNRITALQDFVTKNHPYDTPQFVVLTPSSVSKPYQSWLESAVAATPTRRGGRSLSKNKNAKSA